MQNKSRPQEVFPAKVPDPSMSKGAFSGWKNHTGIHKNDLYAQVAHENALSGDIPVRLLDSAMRAALRDNHSR